MNMAELGESLNALQVEYAKHKQQIEGIRANMCRHASKLIDAILAKNSIYKHHYAYDDLRQSAFVCLLECLETYDPSRSDNFEAFFMTYLSYKIKEFLSSREPVIAYEDFTVDENQDVFAEVFTREVNEILIQKLSTEQRFIYSIFLKNAIVDPLEIASILSAIRGDVGLLSDSLCTPEYIGVLVRTIYLRALQLRREEEMKEII